MDEETFPGFDTSDIGIEVDDNDSNFELRAPEFNYEKTRLNVNSVGQVVDGDAVEAYRFWVMKCLVTERYKYLAYSEDFGVEIEEISKANHPRDISESEIQRTITESLEIDERTLSVDNFEFDWSVDSVLVSFEVESIYGVDSYGLRTGGGEVGRVRIQTA